MTSPASTPLSSGRASSPEPCPSCGRRVLGPYNPSLRSNRYRHAYGCEALRTCECGNRKDSRYQLCLSCHLERVQQRAVEERERAVLAGASPPSECVYCQQGDTDDDPLGLYKGGTVCAHFGCIADHEHDQRRGA